MREILFRGKCGIGNVWVCGYYTRRDNDGDIEHRIEGISGASFRMIPETLGQWTGLKDKDGARIFEGDILKYDDYIFVVKYGKCGGVPNNPNYGYIGFYLDGADCYTKKQMDCGLRNDICYFKDIEVIGNIHDNPELLEKAAE